MLEELERRNYTESTTRAYVRTIADFAGYFHRPPDQLGPEQIREYIAHLFRVRKLADNTVNQRVGALRFFYIKTLRRSWSVEETPYPKKGKYIVDKPGMGALRWGRRDRMAVRRASWPASGFVPASAGPLPSSTRPSGR